MYICIIYYLYVIWKNIAILYDIAHSIGTSLHRFPASMGISTGWLVFFNPWASLTPGAAETACGGRWWRRKADGLLLQEPSSSPLSEAPSSRERWWWWWSWMLMMILIMIIGSFDHLMIMFLESFGLAPQKEAPSPPSIRQSAATGGLSLECWWFSLGWIADTSWRIAREVPSIRDCMGGGWSTESLKFSWSFSYVRFWGWRKFDLSSNMRNIF